MCSNVWAPWCQSLSPKAVSAIPKAASAESGRQKSSEKLVRQALMLSSCMKMTTAFGNAAWASTKVVLRGSEIKGALGDGVSSWNNAHLRSPF